MVAKRKNENCFYQTVPFVVVESRKEQEARWLLSGSTIKASFSQIPMFGSILFWEYKMNKIINKFLLAGDKFMPKMHGDERQPNEG